MLQFLHLEFAENGHRRSQRSLSASVTAKPEILTMQDRQRETLICIQVTTRPSKLERKIVTKFGYIPQRGDFKEVRSHIKSTKIVVRLLTNIKGSFDTLHMKFIVPTTFRLHQINIV